MPLLRTALIVDNDGRLGPVLADSLDGEGWRTFLTSPKPSGDRLELDIANTYSVANAIDEIIRRVGRLDAAVLALPPITSSMIEATDTKIAERMIVGQLIAAHRLVRAVLPTMRTLGHGNIVLASSSPQGRKPGFESICWKAMDAYVQNLGLNLENSGVYIYLLDAEANNAKHITTILLRDRATISNLRRRYTSWISGVWNQCKAT